MKTLRKIDLDSMRSEMQVLMREEEKSTVGGSKIKCYDDPNDVPIT